MADPFPLRWRLVLLDGSERMVTLSRDTTREGVFCLAEAEGIQNIRVPRDMYAHPEPALAVAMARVGAVEAVPHDEPTRAELVAALRAMVPEGFDAQREAAARRHALELLRRVPQ